MVSQFDDIKLSMTNGLFEQVILNTLKQHASLRTHSHKFSQRLILQIERSRKWWTHAIYTKLSQTDGQSSKNRVCIEQTNYYVHEVVLCTVLMDLFRSRSSVSKWDTKHADVTTRQSRNDIECNHIEQDQDILAFDETKVFSDLW